MERIPEYLEVKMKLFRMGAITIPIEYIAWHYRHARDSKIAAIEKNYIVHSERLMDDGWCDGMKFLQLIIEHKTTGKLLKIKWSDSQNWYYQCDGGGWALMSSSMF